MQSKRDPVFPLGFDSYVAPDDEIVTHFDGFTIKAHIEHDPDTNIDDFDSFKLDGSETAELRAHIENARRTWMADEWYFCGVVLSVSRAGIVLDASAASLWGIECNYPESDNSYLTEVANDLLLEAVDAGREALKTLFGDRGGA